MGGMPKIVLVAESPSVEGMKSGDHFRDTEGLELLRQLERVGLSRSEVSMTHLIPTHVPNSNFSRLYSDKACTKPTEELQQAMDRLERDLTALAPNVIVPLGGYALHAVTGLSGIGKWRGSLLKSRWGAKAIPTYAPGSVLKEWSLRPVVLADLKKVKRESWHPVVKLPKRNLIINPSLKEVLDYLEEVRRSKFTSVDIETMRMSFVSCIGFSACRKGSHAICIPFTGPAGKVWDAGEYHIIRDAIEDVLSDPSIEKAGQNFHYDWSYLRRDGYHVENYAFDTLVAQHAAWPEMPKDLGFLASIYTDEPYWKDEGKDWRNVKDWNRYYTYNATDAAVTAELVEPLKREVERQGVQGVFEFEMSLIPVFVETTLRGIKFDTRLRKELKQKADEELKGLEEKLDSLLPEDWTCKKCGGAGTIGKKKPKTCPECKGKLKHINPSSNAQLKELIYKRMGLPLATKKKTHKVTVDEDALVKLSLKHPHPIFEVLLRYRELRKEVEFLKVRVDTDGRIRTSLSCNTDTGRLSSSSSPFGTGSNLQNIKRTGRMRELFVADEGKVLYSPDYSKAEAYAVAFESGDETYINLLMSGGDIHTINAQTIFEKEDINYEERQLGKKVCHGLNYLMGDGTLCDSVVHELGPSYAISRRDAKRFREAYFAKFSGIKDWHDRLKRQLETTRTATNCFGRKRVFLGRPDASTLKKFVAFIPQSTVADLCNRAIRRVREIEGLEFLLQVHDSFLLQGAEDADREKVVKEIVKAMSIPMTIKGNTFTIPVDMKIGKTWGTAK